MKTIVRPLALVWCLAGTAVGQPPDPLESAAADAAFDATPVRLSLFWENDGTVLKPNWNTDRHYTNGAGFALAFQPRWTDGLADGLGLPAGGTAFGLTAGQLMYTPNNINNIVPATNDRPYAGYLYGGVFLQREHDDVLDHLQLDLGVIGPSSLAEETQREVHRVFDEVRPQGWEYQVEDTFTANLTYRRKWRCDLPALLELGDRAGWQLIPYVEAQAGNVLTAAGAGATLRLGWNLPDDFGPGRLRDVGSFTGDPSASRGWSVYLFARGEGRVVGYDATLELESSQDPRTRIDPKPFVAEGQLGVAAAYRWERVGLEVAYSQTYLTDQFEQQEQRSGYGALTARVAWSY